MLLPKTPIESLHLLTATIYEEAPMNSAKLSRTKLYERFHSFDKYHSGWYNYLHHVIRSFIRKIVPPKTKRAY